MTPPIDKNTEKELKKLYYDDKNYFGRDRLYKLAVANGIDISRRQIMEWLKKQHLWQMYAPAEESKDIRSTILNEPHKQLGIDIIDMGNNEYNGYKYILTGIDLFTKKSYVQALKDKSAKSVNVAIRKIINDSKPRSIRSDNGSEFINESFKKILSDNNIKQVFSSAGAPQSNGNIERFNGTIKRLINKDLQYNNTNNWVDSLQQLNDNYNNTIQRVTKSTPNLVDDIVDKTELNEVKDNIYKTVISKRNTFNKKFNIGDFVRIKMFNEKNKTNWTNDIYEIVKIGRRMKEYTAQFYYVANVNDGIMIDRKYYDNDLLLIPNKNVKNKLKIIDRYEISKIVEYKIKNGVPGYLVKWKGYKDLTFEPREILLEDVPKLIKTFDKENNIKF